MRGKSKQNMYNMKGCSKSKTKTRKNKQIFLGGTPDVRLAYPSKGPPSGGFDFLNPQTGGLCSGQCAIMKGGTIMKCRKKSHKGNCTSCQKGGSHLSTCNCTSCQKGGSNLSTCNCTSCQKGGSNLSTCTCTSCQKGGASLPYPNGLVGNAWTPSISGWPGVDGISMGRNHLGYNTYNNDISRQMRDVGANPPYTYLKGGKKRNTNKRNKKRKSKTQKAGTNFLGQDLINVGRQIQYGIGSAYNGIRGYTSPVNPLPWKGQFHK